MEAMREEGGGIPPQQEEERWEREEGGTLEEGGGKREGEATLIINLIIPHSRGIYTSFLLGINNRRPHTLQGLSYGWNEATDTEK